MNSSGIKAPVLPGGTDDFVEIRQWRVTAEKIPFTIADKTRFLPDILATDDKVTVFTRPIRFMKSSTFSMMARFLAIKDYESNKLLFEGLDISDEKYADFRAEYQGQYPVIHLTFKGIQERINNWHDFKEYLAYIMADLYRRSSEVLTSLDKYQKEHYDRIISLQSSEVELGRSLVDLASYLALHYNKKVMILIDEYDTPLHSAHKNTPREERHQNDSYFKRMSSFLAGFFGDALKGHTCVEKGFMTGVSYIAFSSISSSLNNTSSYSIFTPEFAEVFGFTEPEVENFISQIQGIDESKRLKIRNVMKSWYNGYYMGNSAVRMYNPWSVAKFLKSLATNSAISGRAYWLHVGDTIALAEHLSPRFSRLHDKLTNLMLGKTTSVEADERMRLLDLDDVNNDSVFWSLLLHAGYLSASNIQYSDEATIVCDVAIPNYEVQSAYAHLIRKYQQNYDPGLMYSNAITGSLLDGNITEFAKNLQILMERAVSFYDLPKNNTIDNDAVLAEEKKSVREQVYHAFILGLLAGTLTHYEIKSNRESGHGRYDIILIPLVKGKHGFIFEFKSTSDSECLLEKAKEALDQIEKMRYVAELESKEVSESILVGMSFYGKHFHIEHKKINHITEEISVL